jgi:hypothetical protein
MCKRVTLCCLSVLCFILAAGVASSQDTSPYLLGVFNEYDNVVTIANPTTKWLTVYDIIYWGGNPVVCRQRDIPSNGLVSDYDGESNAFGMMKFFAFPQGTRKFDPNAVIGGSKQEVSCAWWVPPGMPM